MEVLKMKRKVYISYVVQGKEQHSHYAEIAEIEAPTYSCSPDKSTEDVLKWKEEKEKILSLHGNEKVVLENFFLL
jgi:DNA-directed RNA polymerase specialized sigma subunit